ncbi:MAG: hypothetical protein J0M12_10960 [Deltaproteobacteria bacterium]|nr:hypothetical protein [Deltaproteobacteria bacterium]
MKQGPNTYSFRSDGLALTTWSKIALVCALLALLVLSIAPYSHHHQDGDSSTKCAACVVQHSPGLLPAVGIAITTALEVVFYSANLLSFVAAPPQTFWIDTLSRGPPAL